MFRIPVSSSLECTNSVHCCHGQPWADGEHDDDGVSAGPEAALLPPSGVNSTSVRVGGASCSFTDVAKTTEMVAVAVYSATFRLKPEKAIDALVNMSSTFKY